MDKSLYFLFSAEENLNLISPKLFKISSPEHGSHESFGVIMQHFPRKRSGISSSSSPHSPPMSCFSWYFLTFYIKPELYLSLLPLVSFCVLFLSIKMYYFC